MVRMSTAPDLGARDGLSSFERAARQPFMLGLFLPHQSGAWTPSNAPRETSWTFEYNAGLAVHAEELGFDLVFALATWLGKGGYGGEMAFRGRTLDPFIASAAFAPLTRNILLISTVHVLYGWHPLHLAKYGAVIDIHLVGSPDMIVDWFVRLKAAGVDGVQVNFYDFGPDLDRFARTVLPLMHEAGLRNPEPAGHDMGSAA